MTRGKVLLLANMNSKWTFRYIQKAYFENFEITVINLDSKKLPYAEDYFEFCENNKIPVYTFYKIDDYSACFKLALFIKQMEDFDVCHVMFVNGWTSLLVRICENKFSQIIANFWGSDFYAATGQEMREKTFLLEIADQIIVPADRMKEDFIQKYPQYQEKLHTVFFENSVLEELEKEDDNDIDECEIISLPDDKLIIAVGYCGAVAQQHDLFIRALNRCPEKIRNKVHIVLMTTYGLTPEYENYLGELLQESKFAYTWMKEYMNNEQIMSFRKRVDLFYNGQKTDAFNSAIQESMLCQSVILLGNWLSYNVVEEQNAFVCKFNNESDLKEKIIDIVSHFPYYHDYSRKNRKILKEYRKNRKNVENWTDFYDFKLPAYKQKGSLDAWNYLVQMDEKLLKRQEQYNQLMQEWLYKSLRNKKPVELYINQKEYNNVVIYGAGTLGKMVYEEIKDLSIKISVCDQNETEVDWFDEEIVRPSDLADGVPGGIIVTPVHAYWEIYKALESMGCKRIVSLWEIISD